NIVPLDRAMQGDKDRGPRLPSVTGVGLLLEAGEETGGLARVADFITQVVRRTAKCVDVAEILPKVLRQKDRDDREILVVPMRQLACIQLGGGEISHGLKCRPYGGRQHLGGILPGSGGGVTGNEGVIHEIPSTPKAAAMPP